MNFDNWQEITGATRLGMGPRVLYRDAILRITCVAMPSGSPWVRLAGELDASNSAAALNALTRARPQDGHLVVDLGQLTFVDLAGIRALTAFSCDGTGVRMRNISPRMRFLLDLLNLPSPD
jgi:anti-anti-sigma factor